ncbi:MAG: prephenate dehydratase [Candidatus Krumholzibacteriia bacterium]
MNSRCFQYTPIMSEENDLQQVREALEKLDRRLLELIQKRMHLVEQIAAIKIDSALPFRDPLREEQVLQRVRQTATSMGLDAHEVERLYRSILEMSIARQQGYVRSLETTPLRVTYQGVEGSYSHLAAQRRYAGRPGGVLLTGYETLRETIDAVREGRADFSLVPIENTTGGSINETYDLLAEGDLHITAEVVSQVEHCLMALPGTRVEDLRTVISHAQALQQCEAFLRRVPWIRPRAEFDTAGSARKVRESGDRTLAAIASAEAARLFGLEILEHNVQSHTANSTRFVEIARETAPCPAEAACKTSLLLVLAHRPGALGDVLTEFSRRSVNLCKIESRPVPESPWEYRFYLDVEGHAASAALGEALETIRPLTSELRVLGTYPVSAEHSAGEAGRTPRRSARPAHAAERPADQADRAPRKTE